MSSQSGLNATLLLTFLLILTASCAQRLSDSDQCVQNMMEISESAEAYRLEHRLSKDALIDPKDLGDFHKNRITPKCPKGTKAYPPFTSKAGPICPNDPNHTELFKKAPSII